MSLLVGNNAIVSIHYTLTNSKGDVVDSSEGAEPLNYLHGANNIIEGLEVELMGKAEGAEFDVTVSPEKGYGPRVEELIQQVPAEAFEGVEKIEIGMMFQTQSPDGQPMTITVTEVADETVTVDGNHPLAGEELNFKGSVVSVRDATEEEVAHGHAH